MLEIKTYRVMFEYQVVTDVSPTAQRSRPVPNKALEFGQFAVGQVDGGAQRPYETYIQF